MFSLYKIHSVSTPYVCRCVDNKIHILLLPAHTTHLLQVADISVFGPFKRYLATSFAAHRISHPGVVSNGTMARLTRKPWDKATSEHNVKAGFKKAGIHPFDDQKITSQIYKQGITERKLVDDSSRVYIPQAPPLPTFLLDSSATSSSSPLLLEPRVETIPEILSTPQPLTISTPKPPKKRKLDTTFSVMVTEKEHVDTLRQHAEQKQKKQQEKEENKRQRVLKKQEKQQQKLLKATQKAAKQKKKPTRKQSNKENSNPNIIQQDLDPYA
jgi:hypothetical protein